MIFDGWPYAQYIKRASALQYFIEFLEKKLGVSVLYSYRNAPFERPDLFDVFRIGQLLKSRNVITDVYPLTSFSDEPPLKLWGAACNDTKKTLAGGGSVESDEAALYAAFGEALERYLWFTQRDYFKKPRYATASKISRFGNFIAPERFVSFTEAQREKNPHLRLNPNVEYLWIQGVSLVHEKKVYLPAQTASAAVHPHNQDHREPLIRQQTTIGTATWPTKLGARLAGILEIIEREAYMVMWFNQLTLPRIALEPLRQKNGALDIVLERCERYRLRVHAVKMITDAPTHAVCAVVEDVSDLAPRFSFGLKAHRSLSLAVERALLEALRARRTFRSREEERNAWDPTMPIGKIGHIERTFYWALPQHAPRLSFLVEGKTIETKEAQWENDSDQAHFERLIVWCRNKGYECVSVSAGTSAANPTRWHVETVVMPDIQPTHLHESLRHLSGVRLKAIPEQFGYTILPEPFVESPHPYC